MEIPIISEDNRPFFTSNAVASKKLFDKRKCHCHHNGNHNCKCNKIQGCNTVALEDIVSILARINYKIASLSEKVYNNLVYKYPLTNEQNHLDKLIIYKNSLSRYKNRLVRNAALCKTCEFDNKIQGIYEKAQGLLGIGYSPEKSLKYALDQNIPELEDGLIYSDAKLNSWLSKNPYCAPVGQWEKLAYHICGKLGIDIEVEEVKCNLTFDIIKESIPLEVIAGLSIGQCAKKKGILNKRSPEECKLDWEILVEKIDCDLNYDVYISLVKDCNLTFDVITEAYNCGLSFETSNSQHYLKGKNFTYNLSDIQFTSPVTSYSEFLAEGIALSENTLDRKKLEKLLSDYHLTEKELRKLK